MQCNLLCRIVVTYAEVLHHLRLSSATASGAIMVTGGLERIGFYLILTKEPPNVSIIVVY